MSRVSMRQASPAVVLLRDFLLGRTHVTALRTPDMMSARTQPPPCLPTGPHSMYAENDYSARDARGEVTPPTVVFLSQDKKDEYSDKPDRKLFVWFVKPEGSPNNVESECTTQRDPCDKPSQEKDDDCAKEADDCSEVKLQCAEEAECCEEEPDECNKVSSEPQQDPDDRQNREKLKIRTNGAFISWFRDFLLGRKHVTALRTPDEMAPRSIPTPCLPEGPNARLCQNDYHTRDARGEVKRPTEIKAGPKRDKSVEREDAETDGDEEAPCEGDGKAER